MTGNPRSNPLMPIAEGVSGFGNQVRRLRAITDGFEGADIESLCLVIRQAEEAIDLAAFKSHKASFAFDEITQQLTGRNGPTLAYTSRRIEAFGGLCRDLASLMQACRGDESSEVYADCTALIDSLTETERIANTVSARLSSFE